MFVQFLIAALAATTVVATSSLVWYKMTSRPRPEPLTKVRDMVVSTEPGNNIAGILGVGSDSETQPINVASAASRVVSTAVNAVEEKARSTVVLGIAQQVMQEVAKLPEDQKASVKDVICK